MTVDVTTKFVVLTTNRSGSAWVMSTSNSLPHVTAQGELFLPIAGIPTGGDEGVNAARFELSDVACAEVAVVHSGRLGLTDRRQNGVHGGHRLGVVAIGG